MKALAKGWVVESNFWLRSVLKLFSVTVHVTPAEAAKKLRALCASGLFKFVGVP